jgi:hypothetical protein
LLGLLKKPNDKYFMGRTWLSWAAECVGKEVVEHLLRSKPDSNLKDRQSKKDPKVCARTPAIWAMEKGHQEVMSLIMEKRKDDLSLHYIIKNFHHLENELGEKALDLVKSFVS